MQLDIRSPCYAVEWATDVPYIDMSAVYNEEEKTLSLFIVNRHESEHISLRTEFQQFQNLHVSAHQILSGHDLQSCNSSQFPDRIRPDKGEALVIDNQQIEISVAPLSYHFIQLKE